jgi:DNA polymerase III delta prime subunit
MDYKYKPTKITDIIGNKNAIKEIKEWLNSWDCTPVVSNIKYKSIFIYGTFGIGKTASVNIILNDYNIIEINPDEECLKKLSSISQLIKIKKNILGKLNILIVHDIDGIIDNGIISKLHDIIVNTCIPIVIIGNDKYNKHLKSILPLCLQIKYTTPSVMDIYNYIKPIIKSEQIKITDNLLRECIVNCKQDIRKILLMIDFPKNKDCTDNIPNSIFESTRRFICQLTPIEDKYDIYKYENEDMLQWMIHENYIPNLIINSKNPIETLDDLYKSSSGLSDYDICYGNYSGLMIASNNSHIKNTVAFPKHFNTLSTYAKRNNIIDSYNNKFNTNHFRIDYMSYIIQMIMANENYINLVNMVIKFGLIQEDIQEKLMEILLKDEIYKTYLYDTLNKNMKSNIVPKNV